MSKKTDSPATAKKTEKKKPPATKARAAATSAPKAITKVKTAKAMYGGRTDRVEEPAHGKQRDASDLASDQKLRHDLEDKGARSPADRHRERLTAVEAEEDDVRGEDDEPRKEAQQREQAISEQDADDEDERA